MGRILHAKFDHASQAQQAVSRLLEMGGCDLDIVARYEEARPSGRGLGLHSRQPLSDPPQETYTVGKADVAVLFPCGTLDSVSLESVLRSHGASKVSWRI